MQALQAHSDPAPDGGLLAVRVRVRYSKRDKLRFVSAIDLGRVWERAVRKADLPIAYSEGFSPHPKISFTDALPLGYASVGEYAELTFAGEVHVAAAMAALNESFPLGIQILDALAVADGDPKFAKLLQASCWDLDYPTGDGLAAAVAGVAGADSLVVLRQRKGEPAPVELRPAVAAIAAGSARVRVVLHHVEPAVRPTEVDLALRQFHPGLPEPALVTRMAQGTANPDGLTEALSGARVDVAPAPT